MCQMAAFFPGYVSPPNGTCGKKGVPCKETFGSEWTYTGKCCNERPCCKSFKSPCVPETTCPTGFRLLPDQTSSAHCYSYNGNRTLWEEAQSICASTPGAYLWRPNTLQETFAIFHEFLKDAPYVWTGANDRDKDGNFTFITDNGPFSIYSVPFGDGVSGFTPDEIYVMIRYDIHTKVWIWVAKNSFFQLSYICEYQRITCSTVNVEFCSLVTPLCKNIIIARRGQ
ncbi:unnamed protein product [Mytilus edulis]|uniref:C-type lectin domain-containing protein n=1 Tax=Mytilus edulis TaxID=6550 RepID=A0A8S3QSY9_MYTED|nr:unnamed protein product [Mytilus edulis]